MIAFLRKPAENAEPSRRFERKFYLPNSKIPFAAHMLAHCCRRDRQYPRGVIHSTYYDTSDLEFYNDSDEGNYTRNKVRIRWYDDAARLPGDAAVFLELKSKQGFAGFKKRALYKVRAAHLANGAARTGIIDYTTLRAGLADFDYFPRRQLHPVILISYDRLRFEDVLTGTRVSLDYNIRSNLLSPQLNRREGKLLMQGGVIEIKGQSADLPPTLSSIRYLATDWSRYSKYAACLESQTETPGSAGRFHPSGRVEQC